MSVEDIITIISNPSTSAILGAIAGATATFIPMIIIEKNKHDKLKNSITKFVKFELEEIQTIINRCFQEGDKQDNRIIINEGSGIRRKLYDVMTLKEIGGENYFVFTPTNYPELTGEIKATIFEDNINSLEYTYRKINELKLIQPPELMAHDYFDEEKCMNLLESLTDVLSKLK